MTVNVFPSCGAIRGELLRSPDDSVSEHATGTQPCGVTLSIPSAERMEDAIGAVTVLQECLRKTTQIVAPVSCSPYLQREGSVLNSNSPDDYHRIIET